MLNSIVKKVNKTNDMSRVLTFSRVYPSYHPKAGQPTYFVEKMIQWYWDNISDVLRGYHNVESMLYALNRNKFTKEYYHQFVNELNPEVNEWKSHTIRYGQRFKVGEFFKPCVWTGRPYRSLMMQFLPALSIPKIWNITVNHDGLFVINGELYAYPNSDFALEPLAWNDGLDVADLLAWFNEPLDGQIICWNKNIEY